MDPPDTGRVVTARQAARIARQHAALDAFVAQMPAALDAFVAQMRHYADIGSEQPPAVRAEIERLLATLHDAFLPPPPPPTTRRGRKPDFRDQEALFEAMEEALTRFPVATQTLTQRALAPFVRTPEGHLLDKRSLEYNLHTLHVSWKEFKEEHKKH